MSRNEENEIWCALYHPRSPVVTIGVSQLWLWFNLGFNTIHFNKVSIHSMSLIRIIFYFVFAPELVAYENYSTVSSDCTLVNDKRSSVLIIIQVARWFTIKFNRWLISFYFAFAPELVADKEYSVVSCDCSLAKFSREVHLGAKFIQCIILVALWFTIVM